MRRKARRGKKVQKRVQKRRQARRVRASKLDPRKLGQSVADALAPVAERYLQFLTPDALSRVISQAVQPLAEKVTAQAAAPAPSAPAPVPEPVAFLGSEQRHTKPLAPYESYVYGFGLSIPVKLEPGDAIEKEETREKFKGKYQTIVNFLMGMMREVETEIEAVRGASR